MYDILRPRQVRDMKWDEREVLVLLRYGEPALWSKPSLLTADITPARTAGC
jgi:hypothetical protein